MIYTGQIIYLENKSKPAVVLGVEDDESILVHDGDGEYTVNESEYVMLFEGNVSEVDRKLFLGPIVPQLGYTMIDFLDKPAKMDVTIIKEAIKNTAYLIKKKKITINATTAVVS